MLSFWPIDRIGQTLAILIANSRVAAKFLLLLIRVMILGRRIGLWIVSLFFAMLSRLRILARPFLGRPVLVISGLCLGGCGLMLTGLRR